MNQAIGQSFLCQKTSKIMRKLIGFYIISMLHELIISFKDMLAHFVRKEKLFLL